MLRFNFLIAVLLTMSNFNSLCGAMLDEHNEIHEQIEKIYVFPDQIVLTVDGIFLVTDTGAVPVSFLGFDNHGLYVMRGYYQCPACRRYNTDNICRNPSCPMFGQ